MLEFVKNFYYSFIYYIEKSKDDIYKFITELTRYRFFVNFNINFKISCLFFQYRLLETC